MHNMFILSCVSVFDSFVLSLLVVVVPLLCADRMEKVLTKTPQSSTPERDSQNNEKILPILESSLVLASIIGNSC